MSAVRTAGQLAAVAGPPEAVTALPHDGDAGEAPPQLLGHDGRALHRLDRGVDDRVGERPAGQPAVLPPGDEDDDRRAVVELVLELSGEPHTARRLGLPVDDGEVDA